jgi:CheY-like chemotaxis protein
MARIFVVDDERIVRLLLQEMLAKAGHQVEAFDCAKPALEKIAEKAPDLLITDIFMPEKSGLEMILELRQTNSALKIIAISGDSPASEGAYKDSLDVASALGSAFVIEKPFTAAQVTLAVEKALAS